jgi:uncharacterized protein YbdZ (MbtH family)
MKVLALTLLLACGLHGQYSRMAVTTMARAYQSPDGAFSLEVPAGWTERKAEGSNEVSFVLGSVSVSVGAVPVERGETVGRWLEASKSILKEQCPAAEVQTESKATVAGQPGERFTMFCPGPRPPVTVRESAALANGKIFTFSITAPALEMSQCQADIDAMAKSFRPAMGEAGKPPDSSYQDPAHRFSLDIPSGWTLTPRGGNGEQGVVLAHESSWIIISPAQGERVEETLDSYLRQVEEACTDLRESKHGLVYVNGHRALTDSFTGADKNGIARFFGMTDIDMGRGNSVAISWSALQADSVLTASAVEKLQQGIW